MTKNTPPNTNVVKSSFNDLSKIILSDNFKKQIRLALPKHLTADRFARIALTELRNTPKLLECTQESFLGAIVQASQLGLEPGNSLGSAYLIPFDKNYKDDKGNWHKEKQCQLLIGYRGYIELARRSGQIESISARCVYEGEHFECDFGIKEKLEHCPNLDSDVGEFRLAYAIARFKGGGYQVALMTKRQIEKIRKESKAAKSSYSPWNNPDHYPEMCKKTVIRRLCKYLPLSPELSQAVALDGKADIGQQNLDIDYRIFDGDTQEIIKEEPKKQTDKMKEALKKNDIPFDEKYAEEQGFTLNK